MAHPRPPATNVSAVLNIARAKLFAQGCLLIEHNKQVYSKGDRHHGCEHRYTGVSEDNPKPDPSRREANVHWVSHVAIEPHHDQSLGRSYWCRCTASRPPEVPNAAHGDCESEHRRHCREPSPPRRPAMSTRKPSHPGSNQNHSAKNPAPTSTDATVVGHRFPNANISSRSGRSFAISPPRSLRWLTEASATVQPATLTLLPQHFILRCLP